MQLAANWVRHVINLVCHVHVIAGLDGRRLGKPVSLMLFAGRQG